MAAYQIIYFTKPNHNPVREFINSLNQRQQVKLLRIFQTISLYGPDAVARHLKKLTGTPLWEIRFLGQDNLRIIYFLPHKTTILILHGFVKKSTKTPPKEIRLALARYQDWLAKARLAK